MVAVATKPNYLPNWNNVTPVAPLTKKKNETPVLPAVPVKLGSPVLPSVPVKLATPVTPPVVKKNETPVLPGGPVVNKTETTKLPASAGTSKPDYTDPELFISQVPRYPKSLDSAANRSSLDDRLARANWEYIEDPKLGKQLDNAAKAFGSNQQYRVRYEKLLSVAESFNMPGKQAARTAALNLYRDIRDIKSSDIPEVVVPKLLAIKGSEPLLDSFQGNIDGKREYFIRQYVRNGQVSDRLLYDTIAGDLKVLGSDAARDTYLSLLQGWEGTHTELVAAAKSLSQD